MSLHTVGILQIRLLILQDSVLIDFLVAVPRSGGFMGLIPVDYWVRR